MSSQKFYLVGDSSSTAKDIPAEPAWKLETLKKTVAQAFNVAVPAGKYSSTDCKVLWFLMVMNTNTSLKASHSTP